MISGPRRRSSDDGRRDDDSVAKEYSPLPEQCVRSSPVLKNRTPKPPAASALPTPAPP